MTKRVKKYEQRYRAEWEQNPEFSSWLCMDKASGSDNAFCKACSTSFLSRFVTIKKTCRFSET